MVLIFDSLKKATQFAKIVPLSSNCLSLQIQSGCSKTRTILKKATQFVEDSKLCRSLQKLVFCSFKVDFVSCRPDDDVQIQSLQCSAVRRLVGSHTVKYTGFNLEFAIRPVVKRP